jgi:hypothetical protein
MSAGCDLEEDLTMVVSLPEPFTGLRIGLQRTLEDERLSPATEEVLENHTSQLQTRWMLMDANGCYKSDRQ